MGPPPRALNLPIVFNTAVRASGHLCPTLQCLNSMPGSSSCLQLPAKADTKSSDRSSVWISATHKEDLHWVLSTLLGLPNQCKHLRVVRGSSFSLYVYLKKKKNFFKNPNLRYTLNSLSKHKLSAKMFPCGTFKTALSMSTSHIRISGFESQLCF